MGGRNFKAPNVSNMTLAARVVGLLCAVALPDGLFVAGSSSGWVPDQVGVWSTYTGALPNNQLPDVPLLGNGALGVLLDAHQSTAGGHVGTGGCRLLL